MWRLLPSRVVADQIEDGAATAPSVAGTSRFAWVERPVVVVSGFVLVVLVAVGQIVVASASGVGLSPDGVTYLAGAQILASDPLAFFSLRGELGAFDRFPPFYSLLLSIPGWFGVDPGDAAMGVNIALLIVFLILMWLLVSRHTSPAVGVAGCAAVVVVGGFVITNFGWVLAEGLFLTLTVAALAVLDRMFDARGRWFWGLAAGAGFLIGLALLSRLLAVGLLATAGISILLFVARGRKIATGLVVGVPAVVLTGLWLAGRTSRAGVAGRPVDYHPPGFAGFDQLGDAVSHSIFPVRVDIVALGVVVAAIGMLWAVRFLWTTVRSGITPRDRFTAVLTIFVLAHTGVIFVATTFFDGGVPFDRRLMGAVIPAIVAIVAVRLTDRATVPATGRAVWVRRVSLAIVAVLVLGATTRTLADTRSSRVEGLGYHNPSWARSESIEFLESLPESTIVYTNGVDATFLLTGRVTRAIPAKFRTDVARPVDVTEASAEMLATLRAGDGVVVLFESINRKYLMTADDLEATGFEVVEQLEDGVVLAPTGLGR